MLIAPGFDDTPGRYELAVELSRITFPYILLMSLTALLGGVLNSFDRFGPFAAAPILFNFSLIVAMLFFADLAGSAGRAMAWGVVAAGILQLAWMIYACRRIGVKISFKKPRLTSRVRLLLRKMMPGVMGAGVAQINIFVDMIIASLLPVGAISFLYYADRMYQLPLSVVGIAIGTAILPMLTKAFTAGDTEHAGRLFRQGFELSLALAMPATVAYLVLAPEIMQVLFVRGAFTQQDSHMSALALMGYALGLPAFILSKLFGADFFARHDTATPVRYAIICAILNTVLALGFSQMLKDGGYGHVGIAVATGISAWVNLMLLGAALVRRGRLLLDRRTWRRSGFIVLASIVMGFAIWALAHLIFPHMAGTGAVMQVAAVLGVLGMGGGVYGTTLLATGTMPMETVKALFHNRRKKAKIGQNVDQPLGTDRDAP
jgi:putative peptidoglycan lipid II flippase